MGDRWAHPPPSAGRSRSLTPRGQWVGRSPFPKPVEAPPGAEHRRGTTISTGHPRKCGRSDPRRLPFPAVLAPGQSGVRVDARKPLSHRPRPLRPPCRETAMPRERGTRDEGRGTRDGGRGTRDEGRQTSDERRANGPSYHWGAPPNDNAHSGASAGVIEASPGASLQRPARGAPRTKCPPEVGGGGCGGR